MAVGDDMGGVAELAPAWRLELARRENGILRDLVDELEGMALAALPQAVDQHWAQRQRLRIAEAVAGADFRLWGLRDPYEARPAADDDA